LTAAEISDAEDLGLQDATHHYTYRRPTRKMAPFTASWMLRLHKEIFGSAWPYAGKVSPSSPNYGIARHQVRIELHNLALDSHAWEGDPIERSADLHWRAVHIHPFSDGNGRWARLLANIWLKQKVRHIVDWPSDMRVPGSGFRNEYLDAIKMATEQGNPAKLYDIHRRFAVE